MPEVLKDFTFAREPRPPKFQALLDGQIWKVDPAEFDYDDPKTFISAVKNEAMKHFQRYVQTTQLVNGHVVVRARPEGYTPRAGRKKKAEPKTENA